MIAALAAVCLAVPATFPVDGRVIDWFRPPACIRCEGNRGLEIVTVRGSLVAAPVAGTVEFVGPVGGLTYVVVATAAEPSLKAVIGGVVSVAIARGDRIEAGRAIGRAMDALYVGFRVGPRRESRYVDPAPLFGLQRKRARLVAPEPAPVSLARRPGHPIRLNNSQRHCSVLPPVVASARGPGP
ncbi:MAG: peptidoglycan DD-metalloendopeptidase family protein [Actinomycetota bacterium]